MKISPVILSLLLAGSLAACSGKGDSVEAAQDVNEARNEVRADNTDVSENKLDFDSEFMTEAASGGMLEVELGKLVAERATTAEAKQFAQQMVADHSQANDELKALAAKKNIIIPTSLGNDAKDTYNDVADEQGLDLDKKYLKEMEDDHEKDVKKFEEASQKASDPDIRSFAAKVLPTLQHHLDMVRSVRATVDKQ